MLLHYCNANIVINFNVSKLILIYLQKICKASQIDTTISQIDTTISQIDTTISQTDTLTIP